VIIINLIYILKYSVYILDQICALFRLLVCTCGKFI